MVAAEHTRACVIWRNWALVSDIAEREAQAEADRMAMRRGTPSR
jgi:hypothetical protein